ncbi:MAG TPA: Kdo hydroxylase family protein, partial [Caulobacteraceae bacterium]|nr:Kdo hydroxylase family protein [Caulobacteraceae bacterium]
PKLSFQLLEGEEALLDPALCNGRSKNISFDPASGRIGGLKTDDLRALLVRRLVERFSAWSLTVANQLLPAYAGALQTARTSLRPCEVETRAQSPRKDDRRLHIDAFPANPVQGHRILRLFANIDPEGRPRVWNVGEPFEPFAVRFLPRAGRAPPGSGALLQALKLTKGRRTAYDCAMLRLHDLAKDDGVYQETAIKRRVSFPAGSSWLVFTDTTLHAALEGRNVLEQTFLLPIGAMSDPAMSPLKILERLTGKELLPPPAR